VCGQDRQKFEKKLEKLPTKNLKKPTSILSTEKTTTNLERIDG
jgi:hypothetical protein